MSTKMIDTEMQQAAIATQLSIAITQTFDPPEIGNDFFLLLCDWWVRKGRSQEWLRAIDSIDEIKSIAFSKDDHQQWAIAVEWDEE